MQRQINIIAPNKPIQRQQPTCHGLYMDMLSREKLFQKYYSPLGRKCCPVPRAHRLVVNEPSYSSSTPLDQIVALLK
jgi:hypothetical protein